MIGTHQEGELVAVSGTAKTVYASSTGNLVIACHYDPDTTQTQLTWQWTETDGASDTLWVDRSGVINAYSLDASTSQVSGSSASASRITFATASFSVEVWWRVTKPYLTYCQYLVRAGHSASTP